MRRQLNGWTLPFQLDFHVMGILELAGKRVLQICSSADRPRRGVPGFSRAQMTQSAACG